MTTFHGTSNGPHNDIGNYFGPCSMGIIKEVIGIPIRDDRRTTSSTCAMSLSSSVGLAGIRVSCFRGFRAILNGLWTTICSRTTPKVKRFFLTRII